MERESWLLEHFKNLYRLPAIIDNEEEYTYTQLSSKIEYYRKVFHKIGGIPGDVAVILSDFTFDSISLFFALMAEKAVVVPIVSEVQEEISGRIDTVRAKWVFKKREKGFSPYCYREIEEANPLVTKIKERGSAGLVIFSSGSTGKPKAMLHDLDRLMESYRGKAAKRLNTLAFLSFDHIGGIDTMMRTFSMGGTLVIPKDRRPESVCRAIQEYRVNVLPVSPTFMNLLMLGGADRLYDLSSLRIIAFGAEPMPEPLLKRIKERFPYAKLQQKFGTSETSAIRIKDAKEGSLFFKIDDPNVEYRVENGELWLRSRTLTLGYLNASMECFDKDGWFKTGDMVEVDDNGALRIAGRAKEIINVGGEKVLPAEVEALLYEMPEVADVTVYGEDNAITGQSVSADIVTNEKLDRKEMKRRVRAFCRGRLDGFKIPTKINLVDRIAFSKRYKKIRRH